MENQNKYKTKKKESKFTFQNIISLVCCGIGLLSLLFLLCQGISYSKVGYYSASFNLGNMIFGTDWAGANPGLLSAFIIMLVSSICAGLAAFRPNLAFFSVIGFITSAILWCCVIPLYGNYAAGVGNGIICLITFNFVCAILSFISATYR